MTSGLLDRSSGSFIKRSNDPGAGDDLPDVPLRVLGRMKEQPEDGRGELKAAYPSGFEKRRFGRRSKLRQRQAHLSLEFLRQELR